MGRESTKRVEHVCFHAKIHVCQFSWVTSWGDYYFLRFWVIRDLFSCDHEGKNLFLVCFSFTSFQLCGECLNYQTFRSFTHLILPFVSRFVWSPTLYSSFLVVNMVNMFVVEHDESNRTNFIWSFDWGIIFEDSIEVTSISVFDTYDVGLGICDRNIFGLDCDRDFVN